MNASWILAALMSINAPAAPAPGVPGRASQAPVPCGTRAAPAGERAAARGSPAASIARVAWIAGTWTSTSGLRTIEERWSPPAAGTMLATARTLRDGRMTGFEFLCISERDGTLVYTALPNGRAPATDFTLRDITADSVTFENPAHDFPKSIRYARLPDGSLETSVAGDGPGKPERVVLTRER
jgi:hypothetical protein